MKSHLGLTHLLPLGVLLGLFLSPVIGNAAQDTCIEQGGTAQCTGPEVGPYRYSYVSATWTGPHSFTSEADATQHFETRVRNAQKACSSDLHNPPWQPTPPGLFYADSLHIPDRHVVGADNFTLRIWLGLESNQHKSSMRLTGVRATDGNPPCAANFTSGNVQLDRVREVNCPEGFDENRNTQPWYSYCYRNSSTPLRQRKDFGPCEDCDLQVGNPVNVATGNKYAKEIDYRGTGEFPLEYARSYNSGAAQSGGRSPSGPDFMSRSTTWRGTYDRALLFNEHQLYPAVDSYRHTGQVFRYKLVAGVWRTDANVNDRIVQHVDSNGLTTGWTLITALDEREEYDAIGRLLSIQNRAGVAHTMEYNLRGQLAAVRHSFGHSLQFTYDTYNRLATMIEPAGEAYVYQYVSTNKRLVGITYPDQRSRTYRYENAAFPDALTGINDESQVSFASYSYYSDGRVQVSQHALGADRYAFAYLTANTTEVTDPLYAVRTYSHGRFGGGLRLTDLSQLCTTCGSAIKARSFDAAGNLSSTTDFENNQTTYTFDQSRNLQLSRTEAAGSPRARSVSTTWHPQFRLPTVIEETGRTTTFAHDLSGNVLTRTVLDANTSQARAWAYTYNDFGQVLSANGPRADVPGVADVTTYTYYTCTTGYECGRAHTITNAAGHVTTYSDYNAHGQPLTIIDPNNVVTTLHYDLRQRPTSRTVGTEQTTFEYWPTGLLKKVTLPHGSYLEYTYDAAHRLTDINDAEGNSIHYTLDAMGNRMGEEARDPSTTVTRARTQVFDTLSRLQREIGAAGTAAVTTTFGYDNNGNQTTIAAPMGRDTSQGYDELNRLTSATDPLNGVTQYVYNALDQLTSVTDPKGLVTSYTSNALGDLKQLTSPDTGITINTYDSAGNLATRTDARGASVGQAAYTYDALNRVTQIAYPDHTVTYQYDNCTNGVGRLCTMTDTGGTTEYEYDAQGRVVMKAQTASHGSGGATQRREVHYTYTNGLLTRRQIRPGGIDVYYDHNAAGRIAEIRVRIDDPMYPQEETLLTDVLYDADGRVLGWTWGGGYGQYTVREYDQDGRPTIIDSHGQSSYTYDDAGRITSIISDGSVQWNATPWWTYGYDDLDRVTSASRPVSPFTSRTYSYDANGNRASQGGTDAVTFNYSNPLTSNRLASTSGARARTYQYDAAGNRTSDGLTTFTYDGAGRMVASSAGNTTYGYNGQGVRTTKHIAGSLSGGHYLYDEAGHLIEKCTGNASLGNACDKYTSQQIIWLDDIPVAATAYTMTWDSEGYLESSFTELFQVHTDHLNTPRKLQRYGNSNQLAWSWAGGDPFGFGSASAGYVQWVYPVFDLRFPGQVYDAETGLHYNYYRDYDPSTGRYAQSDPIGLLGGINTYLYADANPISKVDRKGLNPAAAVRGAWWAGTRIGGAISYGVEAAMGASIGSLIYDLCNNDSEEVRCRGIKEKCHKHCVSMFEDDPDSLIGNGSDWFGRLRSCVRECMDDNGCHNF